MLLISFLFEGQARPHAAATEMAAELKLVDLILILGLQLKRTNGAGHAEKAVAPAPQLPGQAKGFMLIDAAAQHPHGTGRATAIAAAEGQRIALLLETAQDVGPFRNLVAYHPAFLAPVHGDGVAGGRVRFHGVMAES